MKKRILSMILALAMVLSLGLSVFAEGEETQADIVDAAFALESGASLEGTKTLTGEVSYIVTAYSEKFDNVTVNIHVLDGSGNTRTIQCYQMKGADAATVGVGDVITVTGTIKNYNGLVEFDKACTFVTESKAVGDYPIKTYVGYDNYDVTLVTRLASGETTLTDILYKFKNDKYRDWNYYGIIVVGADNVVTAVYSEYGTGYSKADVEVPEGGYIIGVNGKNGDDHTADWGVFDVVAVGSTIRLFGADLEAAANVTAANTVVTGVSYSVIPAFVPPTTEEEILAAAFALEPGTALPGGPYSLTGVVNKKTDSKTQVNITVGDKDVLCYQMNADDYAAIAVGDTVIVTGNLKNYNGVVEFDTGCTAEIVDIYFTDAFEGAEVINVTAENGRWQNPKEPELLTYTLELADDGEYLYVRVVGDAKFADEISTYRLWIRSNDEATVYTHFYDVDIAADGTVTNKAKYNTSLTENKGANIENSGMEFAAKATEDEKTLIVFRVPLAEFNGASGFAYYSALMFKGVDYSYYPAPAGTDIANMPYKLWDAENEGLYKKVHPITENVLDLEELKIINVITFTADDPSIGTVRISGSVDGEEYYDLNNNGAAKVNADTGVASVALTTQGYIQIRYIKVTGTDVHGEITATFKEAAEGAFIAPPAGPYDFGLKEDNPYCIVMLENRTVDINAVKGDDYVVAPKNNQLIITQKVANGVYKIIANSVNAWPDQGHPELITAGIEGLDIDEDGIITLADDQFAFVIVSSGSINTAGDEQTAPAKRIDRGLGVNGYWRVDGDKVTLHVNQPEPVEEPEPEPYEATVIVADNAILTDGETGFQGAWGTVGTGDVLLVSNPQCTTVPMIVTIIDELDEITEISKVILDLYHDANVMIGYPEGKAAVSVSADGETYTDIGEFDLVAADLGTGNHGTVSNVFEFEATEAKFVKIVLNVGSNAAVLGDSPADGKVNWEFISIAEITVEEAEELPEGATEITHFANYGTNVSSVFFRIGEAKTIGEVIEITYGTVKNFAWSNAMVVDADGKIIEIVPDGQDADKTNLEIPEGGFIITGHGSSAAYTTIAGALVGGTVELINVDEEALVNGAVAVALTNAAFVYTEPEVERPISYQKPYTVAKANGAATYWSNTAGTVTLDDDGVIITDGKYGSLAGDTKGNYVALNQLASGAGIFVVDLGENYYVDKFDVHTAANTGWGIPQGKYIVVSYSTDGENFTQAGIIEGDGEIYSGTGSGWTAYYQELQLDRSVSARYVKFEVTTWGNFLWISEVEVWEGEEPEPMGDTTIDGVFDDDIWADVEWTTYDGYTKGTWQQYQKKGTYTYKTAIAEDDDYIYFAGEVSCLNVTQIRLWFRTNPEASLYTHFVDVYSDGRNWIKKNTSLTTNSATTLDNVPEYALIEDGGKTYVEIKVAKSDLDMDGDYDFIPQASVDGFSNLLGAEIIHGNFVYGGATMTYFPWVGWPAAPEETYVGLIPVTNHWIFTDITSGDTVGVINKAHYERQEDGSLRFVVGGTDLYPLVTYYYEEAKVYNVARGTLNYKFTTDRHNTNITFVFQAADGTPYSFPLANSAAGFAEGQYNAGTGDILPGTYEGSVALADLVASASLYGNNPFPEADATELKFTGIQIYACGITDPAGGVYIDDLSVTVDASEPITEKIFDLEAEKVVGTITFTAEDPTLETIRISGSIDGEEYYDLNSNGNVAVADGVATLNIASKGYIKVRYIKVEGTNVNGTLELEEPAVPDDAVVVPPAGPYPMTGLNGAGYGIAYFTAEDAPEGFGLNAQDVFYSNDKPIKLNSAIITIAQKVDEGVYQILWNDCNGWSKETGAAHFNTPEGVEGIDYHDDKVFLAEDQIVFVIMSSGGYATANDGVYSTGKWILRGLVAGNYLRLTEDTAELFINQPAAVASQEELSIADFDQDGDIDSDDAIYLLRAVLFPEDYEITLAAPFYGDRNPTSDDAIYLLRHVLFPKDYPLPLE